MFPISCDLNLKYSLVRFMFLSYPNEDRSVEIRIDLHLLGKENEPLILQCPADIVHITHLKMFRSAMLRHRDRVLDQADPEVFLGRDVCQLFVPLESFFQFHAFGGSASSDVFYIRFMIRPYQPNRVYVGIEDSITFEQVEAFSAEFERILNLLEASPN